MPSIGPRTIVENGIPYMYDQVREKILSSRTYLRCGVKHRSVSNRHMRLEDGQPAMLVGDGMIRKGTITGLVLHTTTAKAWTFEVFKKGTPTPIATLASGGADFAKTESTNADFAANDVLLYKVNGVAVPYPRGVVEVAWRI